MIALSIGTALLFVSRGDFVGLSVAQLFLICSTAAASSSSMMLRI